MTTSKRLKAWLELTKSLLISRFDGRKRRRYTRRMGNTSTAHSSIEAWARAYIKSDSLTYKLSPPPIPESFDNLASETPLSPGRPSEFEVVAKAPKMRNAYGSVRKRAQAAHTFLHHELQAAELMCWALLRFSDTPEAFRRGLLRIVGDEIRHMHMYAEYLHRGEYEVGAFAVRDWFWDRVPQCGTASHFVATMGMGFEAANLDHAERFASIFDAHGDTRGANMQRQVGLEEIAHVRFATQWFTTWNGEISFEKWRTFLPAPLSPMVMRGKPLNTKSRTRAGLSADFCEEIRIWQPTGL